MLVKLMKAQFLTYGTSNNVKMNTETIEHQLFFESINKLNFTILAEVPLQFLDREQIVVLNVSNVHVTRRASMDVQSKSREERTRVFDPANFTPAVVKRKAFDRRNLIENNC